MAIIRVKSDYPTIQAAIDAANSGDEILVEDGVYHEQVIVNTNFIKITGGKRTVLDGEMKLDTGFILNNTRGVEINSLYIINYRNDGIDIMGNGMGNTITNIYIKRIDYFGIFLDLSTTSNKINGCIISGAYFGVLDRGSNLCVENSIILYCLRGISAYDESVHIYIKRCLIYKNYVGIQIYGSMAHIDGNRLRSNRNVGMTAHSSCLIEANEITGMLNYGIHLLAGNCTVRRNRVYSNSSNGIVVGSGSVNTIIDNEVYDNGEEGILVISEGNIIAGNRVAKNGNYDIVRIRANNIIYENVCDKTLPPCICGRDSYLGDGLSSTEKCAGAYIQVPSDYPTIQAAVDAANPGDRILVGNGAYHEQVTINKDFIKIHGGKRTVLDGEMKVDAGFILNGTRGVEIKSLMIQNYRSDGINIQGNGNENIISYIRILNINYSGISLGDGTFCNRIENSVIEGTYYGIQDRSRSLRIDNCQLSWNGYYGAFINGTNTLLSNSIVSDNYNSGIASHVSGSSIKIAECKIYGNNYCGIEIRDNGVVERNEVFNNRLHGILFIGHDSMAKNNQIRSNKAYGIYVRSQLGNSIIENCINDNDMAGIVASSASIVEGNSAQGNKWYDLVMAPYGIICNNDCGKALPPWLCNSGSQTEEEFVKQNSDCETIVASIYVPDDYPTIQAAVDAALPGDIILVRNGIYHEEVTITKSFIKIIGDQNTILDGELKKDSGLILKDANCVEIKFINLKNYKLSGIDIQGSSNENIISETCILNAFYGINLNASTTNTVIIGCSVAGGLVGIYNLSNNLHVEDCRVAYNSNAGVMSDCDQFCIQHSYVYNNFGSGISCQQSEGCDIITDCVVYENRYQGISARGISLVKGNMVYSNFSGGIGVAGLNSIVEENTVHSNEGGGIDVSGAAAVIRNIVYDNGGTGIYLETYRHFVEGNTAQNNAQYDMIGYRANNTIINNSCEKSLPPWICQECKVV